MRVLEVPRKVSFFPLPLSDELLDSLVYRYHHLAGHITPQDTIRALFGQARTTPRLITNCLNDLFERIPSGIFKNVNTLINQMTLAPALHAIFSDSQLSSVIQQSHGLGNFGMGTLYRSPIDVVNTNLHCCPICIREETKRLGIAYWHRSHQIHGVSVCHLHGCDLLDACPHCKRLVRSPKSMELPEEFCAGCQKPLPTLYGHPESVHRLAILANEACSGKVKHSCTENWLIRDIFERINGDTAAFCAAAMKCYGTRYCAQGRRSYYTLQGDWLGYRNFRLNTYARVLVVIDSLYGSWEAVRRPQAGYRCYA